MMRFMRCPNCGSYNIFFAYCDDVDGDIHICNDCETVFPATHGDDYDGWHDGNDEDLTT